MSALSLAPRALYEEVAELLRQRIFKRELVPGSWIDEMKLAEEKIRKANAELARSQEELRDSEALYHSLVETLPQNIFRNEPQLAGFFNLRTR